MNHFSVELFILYVFCTLQLQTHLLIMESKSKPLTNTVTSTEQDPMPLQQSAVSGKKESDETPTSSTPNPAPTSVVQKCCNARNALKLLRKEKILKKHLQDFYNLHQQQESYQTM